MADNVDFGTTNSNQISKDVHGSDSPIPLSPQWLFPKPGENKSGSAAGENHFTPSSVYGRRPDVLKSMKNDEEMNDIPKKKDVFRPTVLDMDSGRRERWRDEERDTNSSVRRDRWREGDKEHLGDTRKADRWNDNPSARTFGEARRTPSERWNDSGNKDTNHDQRRDSKWNTRWGPDDKETESTRDKWMDSKDADLSIDKGFSHHNHHAKDEMEGDHYRPWRMNAQNRGKVEPPHHQTSSATKQGPAFVYGRGRGENAPPNFSHGWGRVGSGGSSSFPSQSFATVSERGEIGHGEHSHLKYSRIQLLDVYRKTDMRSWHNMVDTVLPVPSLTQEEALLPLALCASSSDEQIILNGIDKGEIVSSGAPQITKEGSIGRNTNDSGEFRRTKFGSREDLPVADDQKVENVGSSRPSESSSYEKRSFMHSYGSDSKMGKEQDPKVSVWRSPSVAGRTNSASLDRREIPTDVRSRESAQQGGESAVRRMQSAVPERTPDTGRLPQSSPENLLLYYKDPRGDVQGPFSGSDIIGWFEAGYFGIDLQVRAANAPPDYPFSLLGDVMPHLRAKARPPPGFSGQVQNDTVDGSGNSSFNASGIFHANSAPIDTRNVEQKRYTHSSGDAENKFLESLMSANMSNRSTSQIERFPSSEGLQGHSVPNATGMSSVGAESGDVYLMAKRMMLERQNSLSNTNQFWPGRDGTQLIPNSDAMHDNAALQARLLASVGDNTRQQAHSQNLMSLLQGLPEGSGSNLNNNAGGWSTFPVQSGLDPIQEKLGFHHGQNFPPQSAFGIQQPRPQNQNLSSLANLLAQKADSSSSILTPEKLLASGLSQDPQVLNLLQQQQYLLQMQSQVPFQSQPISLLDQLLLLKQQQLKQEEQQKLLWQQQQLLSQVLSDPNQRMVEQSYGQLQSSALPTVNTSVDHKGFHSTNNFQIGSQVPTSTLQDEHISNTLNLRSSISQDVSHNAGTEASATLLPHQLFGNTPFQKSWGATLPDQIDDFRHKDVDNLRQSEAVDKSPLEQTMQDNVRVNEPVLSNDAVVSSSMGHPRQSVAAGSVGNYESEILVAEKSDCLEGAPVEQEQPKEDSSVGKEQSNGEVRDVKRASEKKSRKQRSSKAQSTDQAKVASKAPSVGQSKQSDSDFVDIADVKTHGPGDMSQGASSQDAQQVIQSLPGGGTRSGSEFIDAKVDLRPVGPASQMDTQVHSAQRAWKAAPGFKPKSLLEIQQEEQKKAQTEMEVSDLSTSLNSISLPTPWAGVVANADHKTEAARTDLNAERPEFSKNQQKKKSPLHDLLTDAPAKSTESKMDVPDYNSIPVMSSQLGSLNDDNDFIDAKESKKNRKKAAKSKGVVSKVAVATVSTDLSVSSSPSDKGKGSRQVQTEKEVLPAVPSGPSLADFVMWKGEPANTAPAPAWSTDSGKMSRPTSLRDILKEEGKKGASIQHQIPVPTQKSQPSQAPHGNGPSWSLSASSPGKSGSPVQVISRSSSQAKHNGDDDLFWGPIDQPKQDVKQSDFPQLGIQGTSGSKHTSGKGNFEGSLSRQKSVGVRAAERNLSSSPATIQMPPKGKKDSSKTVNKRSEAMDFRDWCESESARLIGTKDTSFLEYCLKQSKSEAEILLIQNLGSFDPRHEFIEKFLNYKEMLPADVLEAAFSQNDRTATGFSGTADMNSGKAAGNGNSDNQGAASGGGGKKKGKKGKKVSPSVLGFNVVSNRIMMGEIQTIED